MIHTVTPLEPEEIRLCTGAPVRTITDDHPESALFFDIETTGLSPDTAFAFLIGCICYEDGQWTLQQFMIRFVQEERQLLTSFFALVKKYQMLIHFNGNRFDIPFLNKRAAAILLDSPLAACTSVDLYLRYRSLKNLLHLAHMNQHSLEEWVGWHREDELSGRDMVGKYWSYSVNGDKETEGLLLKHNRDDLRGMLRVPAMEGYLSLSAGKILPEITAGQTRDYSALNLHFETTDALPRPLSRSKEIFPGSHQPADPSGAPAGYCLSVQKSSGTLRVPIFTGRLRHYFPDYKNYYYLPVEHQVIHKSVASLVDKNYRRPATPENCYAEQSGRFLPQPEVLFTPVLKENNDSQVLFFSYSADFCTKKEDLRTYTQALLSYLFT